MKKKTLENKKPEKEKEKKKKENEKEIELTETTAKPSDIIKKINEENNKQIPPRDLQLKAKPSIIASISLKISQLTGSDLADLKDVIKRTNELVAWITKTYSESIEQLNLNLINTLCEFLIKSRRDIIFKNLTDLETALKEILISLTIIVRKVELQKKEKELEAQKKKK